MASAVLHPPGRTRHAVSTAKALFLCSSGRDDGNSTVVAYDLPLPDIWNDSASSRRTILGPTPTLRGHHSTESITVTDRSSPSRIVTPTVTPVGSAMWRRATGRFATCA